MTEREMEDLVWEHPEKFLNESLKQFQRQPASSVGRADLIFLDRIDRLVVIELKRGTLERGAVAQIVDYFGMVKSRFPDKSVELMIIANGIPQERRLACEQYHIDAVEISQKKFRDVAEEVGYIFKSETTNTHASPAVTLPGTRSISPRGARLGDHDPGGKPMSLDVAELMKSLASKRPIFHSGADFRNALAKELANDLGEGGQDSVIPSGVPYEPSSKRSSALWLPSRKIAIELKYKTNLISEEVGGEPFCLKAQNAQDEGRYSFLKDIERLEKLARTVDGSSGYAIILTNDPSYWKAPSKNDWTKSMDADFRLHEGRSITDELKWLCSSYHVTKKDSYEEPIVLASKYECHWHDFSSVGSSLYRAFRYLALSVG